MIKIEWNCPEELGCGAKDVSPRTKTKRIGPFGPFKAGMKTDLQGYGKIASDLCAITVQKYKNCKIWFVNVVRGEGLLV